MPNVRERPGIEKTGKHEAAGNPAFVAGAINLFGHISIKAVRGRRAFVDHPGRWRCCAMPKGTREPRFRGCRGRRNGRDLPITTQVAFELRPQPRESRTDAVGFLKRIGRNRDKTLVAVGLDSKQRFVGGPEAGRRQLGFREAAKGPVIGDIDCQIQEREAFPASRRQALTNNAWPASRSGSHDRCRKSATTRKTTIIGGMRMLSSRVFQSTARAIPVQVACHGFAVKRVSKRPPRARGRTAA